MTTPTTCRQLLWEAALPASWPRRSRPSAVAAALLVCLSLLASACGTRVTGEGAALQAAAGRTAVSGSGANGVPTGEDAAAVTEAAVADAAAAVGSISAGPAGGGPAGSSPSGQAAGGATGATPGASPTGGPAAAIGTNTQGVSDTEVKFGASFPLSGVTGFLGAEAAGAADSYFQTINAKGGVNGRKLKLVTLDDRFDSSQTLANVRKLWEQEKVHGLFLVFGDGAADYVTRNKIPTVVFGVTPKSFSSKYPTVLPIVGNALIWTQEVIAGLKSKGVFKPGMRIGMLYDTQVLDVSPYVPFLKKAWEDAGATVVSTDPFNLTDGDCTSLVLKMKQLNIDYWDFQGLGWVLCASAAGRQKYVPPVGWGNWPTSVGALADQVGPGIAGIWGGAQGDTETGAPRGRTAATDEYVSSIARYHPDLNTPTHLQSPPTIGYYVGAKVYVAALKAQGQRVTTEGTTATISGFENFETGITPPIISFAPNCKTGSEKVWIAQWQYDPATKKAFRSPQTDYFTSPDKDKYGGKCFLTLISDKLG